MASMAPRIVPLVVLVVLVLALAAHVVSSTTRLRSETEDLCAKFLNVSDFVVANCKAQRYEDMDSNCLESFQLFYESPSLLISCEKHERRRVAKKRMIEFMEVYNTWQKRHTCEMFHAKEEHAARHCGGAAVQKPWHEESYPLYCDEIFEVYRANRHDLDAMCERTAYSDAFWEAFADYIASPLCKQYYKYVRGATSHGCARATFGDDTDACEEMFRWYVDHRDNVERDCLEVQGAKPFYKGFYTWKRLQK